MVVKGKFSSKPPKPVITIPENHNPFIPTINALKRKPLQQDALNLLYQIGNIVMPIMKEYGLKIKKLTEMSPKDDSLLGLNVGRGLEIKLRLRPPYNDNSFLPINDLIGTMLHELTHNTFGPHDSNFYKLLDEYTDKQEGYMREGINGESIKSKFKGVGNKLGGGFELNGYLTNNEIVKKRLNKLDKKYVMGVSKLGGGSNGSIDKIKGDPRKMAAEAAMKRARDNKWCHDLEEGETIDDELIGSLQLNELSDYDDDDDDIKLISKENFNKGIKRSKDIEVIIIDDEDNEINDEVKGVKRMKSNY